jgi:hypothetical protein
MEERVPAEPEPGYGAPLTTLPVSSRTEERNWRTVDIDVVRPGRSGPAGDAS